MIRREGFVSNSSSSSFVYAGIYVDINFISLDDINSENYDIFCFGMSLGDGNDIFHIDTEDKLVAMQRSYNCETIFVKVYGFEWECNEGSFEMNEDAEDQSEIYFGTEYADWNSCQSLDQIMNRYIRGLDD